jgi:hypothetical protein
LLVPIRDPGGRVVALLSRRDDAGDGRGKYSYLSSARAGGPGPDTPAHVPLGVAAPCPTCRLTEGALKADLAAALSGLPTVGAAGLAWRPALDALAALGCRTVRLAFDADALDNAHVARALADCCAAAGDAGLAVELERWDRADGKGIDDLLATGKAPELLAGEAALAAIREALAAATAGEPSPAPDELDRLADVLAGGAAALFADRPLLQALARLKAADPAAFAARRAALKGLVSLRDLDAALKPFLREQAQERPPVLLGEAGYRIDRGRLCRECGTPDGGTALVPLCNFTGRIVEVVTRDDGAEQHTLFAVEGARADGRPLPLAVVPAEAFGRLEWVAGAWHGEAVVYAGQGTRDHLRCAIELLSTTRRRRVEYLHTGWREIGGAWHYLHAGGAVGADGSDGGIPVSLPEPLANFQLPAPPEGAELQGAVRASLGLLRLGPPRTTFPLLAAVYRAVLGDTDFALHLAGPTGCYKSEAAALAQQHFGPAMDARHLPASWSSTGNALEGLAFTAKDALLVVDDFCPTGSAADVQRSHREADRLFRGQGNRAGRQRMRADATLRAAKPPRGLTLSTGEDTPRGQSLRARLMVLEIAPGDFGPQPPAPNPTLSARQRDAADGKYAAALAGFLRWLSPQYGAVRGGLRSELAELRDRARGDGQHARTPGIVADLALGLRYLLDFARFAGAVTETEGAELWERGWAALAEAAAAQATVIASAEPTGLFLRLLVAGLASGRAHVAGPGGNEPESAAAWGWRSKTVGAGEHARDEWQPQGRRIGWIDGADLYLEPEAAYAEAQELARHQGESLPIAARTLFRRMKERGLLAGWDERRQRNTVRRTLEGVKDREVLHLPAGVLYPSRPSEPSATPDGRANTPEKADGSGGRSGGRSDGLPEQPSAETVRQNGQKSTESPVGGRFGRSDTGGGAVSRDDSEVL